MSKVEDMFWSVMIILGLLVLLYGVIAALNPILEMYFPVKSHIPLGKGAEISESVINNQHINFFVTTLVLVGGAIKEELKYRLMLNCKWESIFFSLTLMVIDFSLLTLGFVKINESSIYSVLHYLLLLLITLSVSVAVRPFFQRYANKVVGFFQKWIWFVVLAQLLLFSISHVLFSNARYDYSWVVIVANMFLAGGCMTFIRMKFGIIYSMLFHFLYNFIFYSFAFYFISKF